MISRGSGQNSDCHHFCKIWSKTKQFINTRNGITRSKCDLTLRGRYNNPTVAASSLASGPPTGDENCSETADPGFSMRTKLVPMSPRAMCSFLIERLPSVAARGP